MNSIKKCEALSDFKIWASLPKEEIEGLLLSIKKELNSNFDFIDIKLFGLRKDLQMFIPQFKDKRSGLIFNLIPGGSLNIGISEIERNTMEALTKNSEYYIDFDELKPTYKAYIQPFLISQLPLSEQWANNCIMIDKVLFRPEFSENASFNPIYLSFEEIEAILNKFPYLELPTERQWEYACRAGEENSLFYFGNRIDESIVETYFGNFEFDTYNFEQYANSFGLFGLGTGEWCADNWNFMSKLESSENYKVIKSGASIYYPWSNIVEILMGASCFRQSSEFLEDNTCGVRFVINLMA